MYDALAAFLGPAGVLRELNYCVLRSGSTVTGRRLHAHRKRFSTPCRCFRFSVPRSCSCLRFVLLLLFREPEKHRSPKTSPIAAGRVRTRTDVRRRAGSAARLYTRRNGKRVYRLQSQWHRTYVVLELLYAYVLIVSSSSSSFNTDTVLCGSRPERPGDLDSTRLRATGRLPS